MPSYCTANDVAAFLQVDDFSGSTTPTSTDVEAFIDMAEGRIEELTNHAWSTAKVRTVTDERARVQTVRSNAINVRGRIQLAHYPINNFSTNATPNFTNTNGNVKIWEGSAYVDYCDSANGKDIGTSVTDVDGDMWVDTERGIIYIENYATHNMLNSSPAGVDAYVSYEYGDATTPQDIKLATIYFTASTIAANDDLNLMQEADDSMDNATKSQKFEDMAMKILTDNGRLDRDMTMARAIGGFGVGRVVD